MTFRTLSNMARLSFVTRCTPFRRLTKGACPGSVTWASTGSVNKRLGLRAFVCLGPYCQTYRCPRLPFLCRVQVCNHKSVYLFDIMRDAQRSSHWWKAGPAHRVRCARQHISSIFLSSMVSSKKPLWEALRGHTSSTSGILEECHL